MIRIRTGSRLHFGLFSLPSAHWSPWLNHDGAPVLSRRQFGGVGLMIDQPGIELAVETAPTWSAKGPLATRALEFAQQYCSAVGIHERFQIRIQSAAPAHVGLGTGTQLALAVIRGIAASIDGLVWPGSAMAGLVGRARRSAIGALGFDMGGFLVEGGKSSANGQSPLLMRQDLPEEWRILLITPHDVQGTHGQDEIDAFAALVHQDRDDHATDAMCRLVLLGMLPALLGRDLSTFGEALYDFNRRAGDMFRPVQGGVYAHPRIEAIVQSVRAAGVKGVGQSSWGPTIFAIGAAEELASLGNWLTRQHGITEEEMAFTSARNYGAEIVGGD